MIKKIPEVTKNFIKKHGMNILVEMSGLVVLTMGVNAILDKIEQKKIDIKMAEKSELMDDFEMMGVAGYAKYDIPNYKDDGYIGASEAHDAYLREIKSAK